MNILFFWYNKTAEWKSCFCVAFLCWKAAQQYVCDCNYTENAYRQHKVSPSYTITWQSLDKLFRRLKDCHLTHPFPAPTDTTCMLNPPLPRTGLFPAHWPTTMPAISSFPPWGGMDWRPGERNKQVITPDLKSVCSTLVFYSMTS